VRHIPRDLDSLIPDASMLSKAEKERRWLSYYDTRIKLVKKYELLISRARRVALRESLKDDVKAMLKFNRLERQLSVDYAREARELAKLLQSS